MIKVWLLIMACQAPNFTECVWMEHINMTAKGPVACQLARIPVSHWWRHEVQVTQGLTGWSVFTTCELDGELKK